MQHVDRCIAGVRNWMMHLEVEVLVQSSNFAGREIPT
jgi:hypothetical protein